MRLFSVCSHEGLRNHSLWAFQGTVFRHSAECHKPTSRSRSLSKLKHRVYVREWRNVPRLPEPSYEARAATPQVMRLQETLGVHLRHKHRNTNRKTLLWHRVRLPSASFLRCLTASPLPLTNHRTCHQPLRGSVPRFMLCLRSWYLLRNRVCPR